MTAQHHDTLTYRGQEFQITAVREDAVLFDPEAHGFSPTVTSTSCWRGYECHYVIDAEVLFLETLWITHGAPKGRWAQELLPMPRLNGIAAIEPPDDRDEFQGRYDHVHLKSSYTGNILISINSLSDEPRMHGLSWPWHFHSTLQLSLLSGGVTISKDITETLKVFESRYCTEGYFYGDQRRNGLRYLRRHIGSDFRF